MYISLHTTSPKPVYVSRVDQGRPFFEHNFIFMFIFKYENIAAKKIKYENIERVESDSNTRRR